MVKAESQNRAATNEDEALALSALEYDQLVENKKRPIPRRRFSGAELALIWTLRVYVVFMVVAVVIQIMRSG